MPIEFHIGERVRVLESQDGNEWIIGREGTVCYNPMHDQVGVQFDESYPSMHSCNNHCPHGFGWHIDTSKLILVGKHKVSTDIKMDSKPDLNAIVWKVMENCYCKAKYKAEMDIHLLSTKLEKAIMHERSFRVTLDDKINRAYESVVVRNSQIIATIPMVSVTKIYGGNEIVFPLGRFEVILNTQIPDGKKELRLFTECITNKDYPYFIHSRIDHPHCSGGLFCFGEAKKDYISASQTGKWKKALNMIWDSLNSVNIGGEYVSLVRGWSHLTGYCGSCFKKDTKCKCILCKICKRAVCICMHIRQSYDHKVAMPWLKESVLKDLLDECKKGYRCCGIFPAVEEPNIVDEQEEESDEDSDR